MAAIASLRRPRAIRRLVDNVLSDDSTGGYVNAFERLRDPSHIRAWSMEEWRDALTQHGLSVMHEEELAKKMDFAEWASRHDATMQRLLRGLLTEVTPEVAARLTPQVEGGKLTFGLREGLFVAQRSKTV